MPWIKSNEKLPVADTVMMCKLQHATTNNVQEHLLRKVDEDDVAWRTADDNSEVSYDWSVVEWFSADE